MANITRYTPTRDAVPLRTAMDRLFQDAFMWPGMGEGSPSAPAGWSLPSNLSETGASYVFQAALPGVNADALEITAQQNVLRLKGTWQGNVPQDARSIWASLPTGEFAFEVALPAEFDPAGVRAEYQDGILTLTLPKAAHAKAHTIKVTTNGRAK